MYGPLFTVTCLNFNSDPGFPEPIGCRLRHPQGAEALNGICIYRQASFMKGR